MRNSNSPLQSKVRGFKYIVQGYPIEIGIFKDIKHYQPFGFLTWKEDTKQSNEFGHWTIYDNVKEINRKEFGLLYYIIKGVK